MPRDKRNLVGAIEYFFIGAGGKGRGGRVLEHDGRGFDSGGIDPTQSKDGNEIVRPPKSAFLRLRSGPS